MRKVFLYMLAAFMLSSCDNLKKKSSESDDEISTKKKKKALDDEETTDEESPKKKTTTSDDEETPVVKKKYDTDEDTKTTDYGDGWSKANQESFMSVCVDKAKEGMGSETKATNYCACMLDKIQKLYPDANDAGSLTSKKTTELAKDCVN